MLKRFWKRMQAMLSSWSQLSVMRAWSQMTWHMSTTSREMSRCACWPRSAVREPSCSTKQRSVVRSVARSHERSHITWGVPYPGSVGCRCDSPENILGFFSLF